MDCEVFKTKNLSCSKGNRCSRASQLIGCVHVWGYWSDLWVESRPSWRFTWFGTETILFLLRSKRNNHSWYISVLLSIRIQFLRTSGRYFTILIVSSWLEPFGKKSGYLVFQQPERFFAFHTVIVYKQQINKLHRSLFNFLPQRSPKLSPCTLHEYLQY